ncbi:MAG: zinc dependent phospholipase C family protein [Bacteroidota bacterium]|jgi:hypothetical protein|nr:zinc dependent phospholipase C family protein [Bacteroidota bacterium]
MAGALTHMAIVRKAHGKVVSIKELKNTLVENKDFVMLGSVSPDIPYLSHTRIMKNLLSEGKIADVHWADIMHYLCSKSLVENAIHTLSVTRKNANWYAQLAWLLGYVSHLVADATVHPVVELIVGPCAREASMKDHRICEMTQDVLVMQQAENNSVHTSDFAGFIAGCGMRSEYDAVMEFWSKHLHISMPMLSSPDMSSYTDSYLTMIDLADGGTIAKACRHLGIDLAFQRPEDVVPAARSKYYASVPLPTGQRDASFYDDVFMKAVDQTVSVWMKMYNSLFTKQNVVFQLPDWNLDTGVDRITGTQTIWRS